MVLVLVFKHLAGESSEKLMTSMHRYCKAVQTSRKGTASCLPYAPCIRASNVWQA